MGQNTQDIHLNWYNKQLTEIPETIWNQFQLETLNVSENYIESIADQISQLANLRMLDLGHNKLKKIPSSIGDLKKLDSYLYLHNNKIEDLPGEIGKLELLRYLNCSNNLLTNLPSSIGNLKNLIEFKLANNQLSDLPKEIRTLTSLRYLDLSGNEFKKIPVLPPTIWELNLRNNKISQLPLQNYPELKKLDLRNNQLNSVPESILTLKKLEKLDLRWNQLETYPYCLDTLEKRGCIIYL
ncbi:leucine-rich repeat domain-containing protein [Flavihumibacter sp. UBA7668]|uniref:leucine-rich repeat domain-containing protein n=1 Tax=Flavihumibacter sp. UBA7668 TaxID=1946542 RepID=UPI0039C87FA5